MIHWYQDLYMDDVVGEKPKRAKRRVELCHKSFRQSLCFWKQSYYAISLAQNEENLFEIIETRQLFFHAYQHLDFYIVGLAGSRDSAILLLQNIFDTILEQDSELPVREFFSGEKFD
jgi:hypothetical protein